MRAKRPLRPRPSTAWRSVSRSCGASRDARRSDGAVLGRRGPPDTRARAHRGALSYRRSSESPDGAVEIGKVFAGNPKSTANL
jgi:hypothetical protein